MQFPTEGTILGLIDKRERRASPNSRIAAAPDYADAAMETGTAF